MKSLRFGRGFLLLLLAALGLRFFQARETFRAQAALFPQPQPGLFRAWITEEPEVLFDHLPGSHATGRAGGAYQPFVREVRAVCELVSYQEDSAGFHSPPGPPRGEKLSGDGFKPLPSVQARITLRLSPEVPTPLLQYGDEVVMEGKLLAPPPAMNPGQFDYAHFLRTRGVAYVMYVKAGKWKKVEKETICHSESPKGGEESMGRTKILRFTQDDRSIHGWFLLRWSCAMKRRAEEAIYGFLPFPENALLDGLLLGERGPLPSAMVETFMVTGTVHILAVSGMMTAFIAGLLFLVLRVLQAPRKWAAGLSILGVGFFVFMTGAHPPVCRAGLFSILALAAVLLERKIQGGRLLLSTALLLALRNPGVLEDLSFQISFLATAGLMAFSARLLERLSFLWKPAALLVTSTLAAQVSVWCLLIYYFNQLSLYAPLANLLIVPLALFATAAGLTAIAGSFLHPFLGNLFGAACGVPLRLLILLADKISLLPGAQWTLASPPGLWVGAFHLLFLGILYFFWPRPRPEAPSPGWKSRQAFYGRGKKILTAAGAAFFSLSTLWLLYSALRPQPFRAVFLSVGHGNAAVLRSPRGRVLVVDGGKETQGSPRYNPVVSYLRHIGATRVEGVLATHPDGDHVGGLVNLVSALPVSLAVESRQAQADSGVFRHFQEALQGRGVRLVRAGAGDLLGLLEPARFEILHPRPGYVPSTHADNNLSLVSLVSFGGRSLLLPGDLERDGLRDLLKNHPDFPRVDWLLAPHHGRATGEPALCALGFHPRFVVLSDGKDYPRARSQYLAENPDAVVLSTSREGAIEVEINEGGKGRYRGFREGIWRPF